MKTNLYLSMIACAAMTMSLASCSHGDLTPEENVSGSTSTAYAKVNITMGGVGTRADDPKFEAGTQDEGKVNSITLVLYDESLTEVIGYGVIGNSVDASGTGTDNVSDKYNKTVELTMLGDKEDAKKLVAYVNTTGDVSSSVADVLKKTVSGFGTAGNFIMTNAGYFKGSDWTVAADIVDGSLYPSAGDAENGSFVTTVYVERLAAKVTTSIKDGATTTATITVTGVDGKTYSLTFDADNAKWAPTGTAESMYLLKNPWTGNLGEWTAGSNRSFWAAGVNYTTEYSDMQGKLKYVSSNDLRKSTGGQGVSMQGSAYTMEHTYGQSVIINKNYNALGAATSVILLGQYKVTGDDDDADKFKDGENGYDFYLLLNDAGGSSYTIFTEKELIQYLFKNTGAELYSAQSGDKRINIDDAETYLTLEWISEKANYTLTTKENVDVYTKSSNGEFDSFTAFATTNARHYNLGYAYFFVPIAHNGDDTAAVGQYGVVRNHSYKLNITEIKKLGAPLDDDHFGTDPENPGTDPKDPGEEPIVPDPTNPVVIKAEIDVLSWHVLKHDVQL